MAEGYDGLELPTLLDGEALVAWLGIPVKTRADYAVTNQTLDSLKPTEFTAFDEFQSRKLCPGSRYRKHLCGAEVANIKRCH